MLSCLLWLLVVVTISQTLHVFDEFDSFEQCWLGEFYKMQPSVGVCVIVIHVTSLGFWGGSLEGKAPFLVLMGAYHCVDVI